MNVDKMIERVMRGENPNRVIKLSVEDRMSCEICGDPVDVQVYKQSGDKHPQSVLCKKCSKIGQD